MFEPKPVEFELFGDNEIRTTTRPYITTVSARFLREGFDPWVWGYRAVEPMVWTPAVLYVRPLPLWLIAKGKERVRAGLFSLAHWAFQHGLIHLACSEGALPRWRDLRLGPGSEL